MGKSPSISSLCEPFDTPKSWLNKAWLRTEDMSAQTIFELSRGESSQMQAAVVRRFPVPKFKAVPSQMKGGVARQLQAPELTGEQETCTEIEMIKRFDEADQGFFYRFSWVSNQMEPNPAFAGFEARESTYYLYGPFSSRVQLLEALKGDPMLQPVYTTWSKFDTARLDGAFEFGKVYLRIKWQGCSASLRPVLEMNLAQLSSLLSMARESQRQSRLEENDWLTRALGFC